MLLKRPSSILNFIRGSKSRVKEHTHKSIWEAVIGLEVHAQIAAESKLFSATATKFAAPVNTHVSFFDASLPGTLPVLNKRCVEAGVLTAVALNCCLNTVSEFDRKHYFYADLPAGYQITQQRRPLAVDGTLTYFLPSSSDKGSLTRRAVRVLQVQLEQDSGKSMHDAARTLIDLNRAGTGLIEIVTAPDFRSADEAAAFIRELQLILQTIGTCDGRMDEGSLRVDASVSLRRPDDDLLGTRTEIKNLNSVRAVTRAIDYEIHRQSTVLDSGGHVINETRSFNVETGETVAMRDKERVHDYRYMPEPNLPPVRLFYSRDTPPDHVSSDQLIVVDEVVKCIAELPSKRRERLQRQYELSDMQSFILVKEGRLADCFEEICSSSSSRQPKVVANLLINETLGALNSKSMTFNDSGLKSSDLGQLVDLVQSDTVTVSNAGKVVTELLLSTTRCLSVRQIAEQLNILLISDLQLLTAACNQVLEGHPKAATSYQKGKTNSINFLMGQVQKILNGRAHPQITINILREKLK